MARLSYGLLWLLCACGTSGGGEVGTDVADESVGGPDATVVLTAEVGPSADVGSAADIGPEADAQPGADTSPPVEAADIDDAEPTDDALGVGDSGESGDAMGVGDGLDSVDASDSVDVVDVPDARPAPDALGRDAGTTDCRSDADCDGVLEAATCLVAACDGDSGACILTAAAVGAPCDDGNACTIGDACTDGTCAGESVSGCGPETELCLDLHGCVIGYCAEATGLEETTACWSVAQSICEEASAASEAEVSWFQTLSDCVIGCVDAEGSSDVTCLTTKCSSDWAVCLAGDSFGPGSCLGLLGCLTAQCDSGPDAACARDCAAETQQAAIEQYFHLAVCVAAKCPDGQDAECLAAATADDGPCADAWELCAESTSGVCGDGVCATGETCSTCEADCGTCPLLCEAIVACADAACLGVEDDEDGLACELVAASLECSVGAEDVEWKLSTDYLGCAEDCEEAGELDWECAAASCLEPLSACLTKGAYGTAPCAAVAACLDACASADWACRRGCGLLGSAAAVSGALAIELCVVDTCAGSMDLATCSQSAIAEGGACAAVAASCAADGA